MRLVRRTPVAGAAAGFAQAARPADETGWREAGWCAIDLEMTGLDPRRDDIISVGAVPIDEGRIALGGGLYALVRSDTRSERGAVLVHKLRVPDLADAPPLEEAIDGVLELLAGRIPVFHTAAVENAFLRPQFARRRVRLPEAVDTEALGRLWLSHRDGAAPEGISLGRLAAVLGHPAETPHHALGDALTTAKAFIALASLLDTVAPQTVGSLLKASRPVTAARRFGPG
ncbi:MAG TPA: exonuclease domain-containing protein [Solirubrobacteraceae bacterium]|nr:exonuclease domain-containing protein [Solirubrobacteraceae bacterium]